MLSDPLKGGFQVTPAGDQGFNLWHWVKVQKVVLWNWVKVQKRRVLELGQSAKGRTETPVKVHKIGIW